jgi:predicted alpha/beta superfamily hydrolase
MNDYAFDGLVGHIKRYDPFVSKHVIPRRVEIWTPLDYSENLQQKYAVLYMHDGENLYDPSSSKYSHTDWGIDEAITRLRREQKIRPAIVVGMWSTDIRVAEYMPQKLPHTPSSAGLTRMIKKWVSSEICSDAYLRFIVEELKPFVDAHYRTLSDQRNTFIMGSSMGGLISLYAMCEYPRIFGGSGCVSTHFPIGRGIVLKYMQENLPDPKTHRFYFDYGTRTTDKTYEKYQLQADKILQTSGYIQGENWITRKFEGHEHSEIDWRKRIHIPLEFLLKNQ